MASYERELNDILERHKMDMKALELTCMKARQDLERSVHYIEFSLSPFLPSFLAPHCKRETL